MAAIDQLFEITLNCGASDLHLTQDQIPKVRLNGELLPLEGGTPLDESSIRSIMGEICDPADWNNFESTGDLGFTYSYEGKARFRASYNKQNSGYGAVFHTIPLRVLSLDELYAPPILKTFANSHSGLILISGPAQSGKSTTLAAIINEINTTQARHILTVEDPIEFIHQPNRSTILQREVGTDIDTCANAISAAARQDIDVILIGDIQDSDSASLAISQAESDTLVLGTLYTNSAVKTIDHIIQLTPTGHQETTRQSLAVSLQAVCCQLLLKRADGQGRIAAHEILVNTPTASNAIADGKTNMLPHIIKTGKALGMQLMDDCIDKYLKQQFIPPQEAYAKSLDKDRFPQTMGSI